MKKKIFFILLTIILVIVPVIMIKKDNTYIMEDKKEHKVLANTIALMYETEPSSGIYETSKDNTWPTSGYTFNATLSKCENGSELSWDNESKKVIMTGNVADKCYVYFNKIDILADYIKAQYTDGSNGLYFHDSNLKNGANDNSYRYSGADPDNYVCFGTDAEVCPKDNLYRIIGLFQEKNIETDKQEEKIKLIKAFEAGENTLGSTPNNIVATGSYNDIPTYSWNGNNGNSSLWEESILNNDILNDSYLIKLGDFAKKISQNQWFIKGYEYESSFREDSVVEIYQREISMEENYDGLKTVINKVGLMYVSDYGYAGSFENWTVKLHNYNASERKNWLHLGMGEWTITKSLRDSTIRGTVISINNLGCIRPNIPSSNSGTNGYGALIVRPTFYLNSDVIYNSGTGTITDPYRVA